MPDLPSLADYTWQTSKIDGSAAGFQQVLPADRRRAWVNFQVVGSGGWFVWVEPLDSGSRGFYLIDFRVPLTLLARDVGPLIQQPWYVQRGGVAGDTMYITELFYISPPHARGL